MSSSAEYFIRRGNQLQYAGQDEAAIAVYREALTVDPQASVAWGNLAMLLRQRGSAEAYDAFAQFIRIAPADDPLVGLATTILRDAGREVPGSTHRGGRSDQSTAVQLEVNTGGKRVLLMADNDSGVEPPELLAALNEFIDADSWLDAYLVLARHPELLSGLASTLLEFHASQGDDRQLAHQAQVNLAVLTRTREVGPLAAFAEADQTPAEEFGHLVRAKREIEPVLQGFNGLTTGDLWQRLDDLLWLCRDDDTYLLLARHAESADDERRAILAKLRLMLERRARGEPAADDEQDGHGPGQELAGELEQAADAASDITADHVARAGEDLLVRDNCSLSKFWRVDVARTVAQCYLRFGSATNDLDALDRAQKVVARVAGLVVPGSWQDAVVAVIYANIAIARYEMTGAESTLALATNRLLAARSRVGSYRTPEAPILNALGNISTLRAEHTGEIQLLREAVQWLASAERIMLRDGMPWMVNQAGLVGALLRLAEQGEGDALSRCEQAISGLMQRFGAEPGMRGKVWELAGRVASGRYRWEEDVADLDTAVQCYQTALDFPETVPADRAHLESNLAFALWRRHEAGGAADDLEQARKHGEAALSAMPAHSPSATIVRRNLVRVYTTLGTDEYEGRAADLLRLDLRVLPDGPDRTVAALNLALALLKLADAGHTAREEILAEAYEAYAEGARTLDPDMLPWESIEFGTELGVLFLTRGAWQAAAASFAQAIDGIEALSGLTPAGQWWEKSTQELDQVIQLGAYCVGRSGQAEQAVTWLETYQAQALRHALRLDTSALTTLAAAGHDELARSYTVRADEIRSSGRGSDESNHSFLGRRRRILRAQLGQLAQQIRAIPGFERFGATPDVEDAFRAAIDSTLLYVAVSPLGGLAFIVDGTDRTIEIIELPEIKTDAIATRGDAYLAALDSYRGDTSDESALRGWLTELSGVRNWLWTALVEPLASVLAGQRPVTFIPSGLLGLLPVAAAESPDGNQRAIDMVDWRFTPSADALFAAQRSAGRADRTATLAVLDPQPTDFAPLHWTDVEAAALGAQTGDFTRMAGQNATPTAVLRAMPNHTTLHFSCHGNAYLDRPLDSYLALAEHTKLTVGTLTDEGRLWGARLCFLSACDSGVAGTAAPQEAVALPSTLIQLGAAAVVASQWPVSDAAAAVLAVSFYHAYGNGVPPATAFAQAQRWLRTASRSEISTLLRNHASNVTELGQLIADLPLVRIPFARAQDWAAFIYTGC